MREEKRKAKLREKENQSTMKSMAESEVVQSENEEQPELDSSEVVH